MQRITSVLCLAAVVLFSIGGCNSNEFGPIGSISGTVTLDGKPIEVGTKVIFMQGAKGYTGFGIVGEAGAYRVEWRRSGTTYDGMPADTYGVMLVPANAVDVDEMSPDEMLAGGPKKSSGKSVIPPKYLRTTTSGLSYDVKAGENTIKIELVSK